MIAIDKMKAAFAATPLCQSAWTKKKDANSPTMLCAISSLVSFAGVQPDLIHKMDEVLPPRQWVNGFALPVLVAEYGIPHHIASRFPQLFDRSENEWKGVTAVLALCEDYNRAAMYDEALTEDRTRFPQHGPAKDDGPLSLGVVSFIGADWGADSFIMAKDCVSFIGNEIESYAPYITYGPKPKGDTLTGKSGFWTAPVTLPVPKYLTNNLIVK